MRVLASLLFLGLVPLAASPAAAPAADPGQARSSITATKQVRPVGKQRSRAVAIGPRRAVSSRPKGKTKPKPPKPPPAPAPVPAVPSRVIFRGDFDGSFSGFYVQSPLGRATISTAHPFTGTGAGRFEVRPGDIEPETGSPRSEVSGPTFNAGEEIFVRDAIRVGATDTLQGGWQLIDQLHETAWGGSPGIAVFLDPGRQLSLSAGDRLPLFWRGPQLQVERWYDLVYRVKLSPDPSQGYVEVWLDGVPQLLVNGTSRVYGQTIQTSQTYFKAGIYRSSASSGVSVVEHDNIVIGTSFAAVMSP